MKKSKRKNNKKRLKKNNFKILLLLIISITIAYCVNNNEIEKKTNELTNNIVKKVDLKDEQNEHEKCLTSKYTDEDMSENLKNKILELNTYLNNYNLSVYYEDITTGFTYKYKEDEVYYGASLIKLVEALYLIDKASTNEINLDTTTVKYLSKYISEDSIGMAKRNVGEEVSLRDLISYALKYSDNTAHFMLSEFIGISNLREYGKSLGAVNILNSGDSYGNQSASDTNIYLKHAYEIMKNNSNYGTFLKECMTNTYYNYLYLDEENNVAHKWGWHSIYFHDIGIIFEDNPYTLSILTTYGKDDYKTIVNDISKKINELHHLFYSERENKCHQEIYNKKN